MGLWSVLVAGMPAAAVVAPAAGVLLVAGPELSDPRFHEAVVLVVSHDARGTAGVILNRPSRLSLAEAAPAIGHQEALSYGGPLAPRALLVLVRTLEPPPAPALRVFADIYLTGVEELTVWPVARRQESRYRVFSGYAGWAPGQLDRELAQGDWLVTQAKEGDVFAEVPGELWRQLAVPVGVAPPEGR